MQVQPTEEARFAGLLQSPLTDSNRRPPPYHGTSQATGRNARQSFPLVSAGFAAVGFATGCHRLQPRGSTRAPSCSTCAVPAVVARACSIVAEATLVDVAVRVARRVPALQARLVDAHSAKVVTVREEARVDRHAAAVGVCADTRHPSRSGLSPGEALSKLID